MQFCFHRPCYAAAMFLTVFCGYALAAEATKVLLDPASPDAQTRLVPSQGSGEQVTVTRTEGAVPGLSVTIAPGKSGYPGLELKPAEGSVWDLSAFGHVESRVTNTGTKNLSLALRVDNAGDWRKSPWNTESVTIKPGATGTVSVIFGYAYGKKPGYPLKPEAVSNLLLFASKADVEQSFRIETLMAAGPAGEKPPVDPASVRTVPINGVLLGRGVALDVAQIVAKNGAQGSVADGGAVRLVFPARSETIQIKPAAGKWDLRQFNEVRATLKNQGQTPVTVNVQLASDGNTTDAAVAEALAPGAEKEVVVPFAPAVTWKGAPAPQKPGNHEGALPGTGTKFESDKVSTIRVTAAGGTVLVKTVTGNVVPWEAPQWLGNRPPVDGEWVQTLNENFDGETIDQTKWSVHGPNYWDKKTRWSKDNAILGGGVLRLRYEKKTGFHNDDPSQKQQDYTGGFLESYGKWVQRYGYFESRMKVPTAPGLWPAFWLMPDRGAKAGPQWVRADTGKGGMEFDIFEHLTRWGPYRYTTAMHWDGYQKDHKATGSGRSYFGPDKDGYVTAGLLWLPGQAVFYCNGREVARWEDARISNVSSNIIYTMPQGGWDNNAIDDKQLPAEFVIDYVRVWQRKDLASPEDGPAAAVGELAK